MAIEMGAVVDMVTVILWLALRPPRVFDRIVQLSGRIESDDSAIANKTAVVSSGALQR